METTWTGRSVSNGPRVLDKELKSLSIEDLLEVVSNVVVVFLLLQLQLLRDRFVNIREQTVTTATNQTRRGIQFRVGERFDTTSLGDKVVLLKSSYDEI